MSETKKPSEQFKPKKVDFHKNYELEIEESVDFYVIFKNVLF